ncbi:uncharacterized protein KY384_001476 [Bacidia gigantensis]|uniref:uncharacterized protein n=1 Tax=Bacidia gigantensis TaxID=2732470 RepID=UPI001D03B178|nr:uncharacterized protein KY384_001476 [Bacidia gigantensis]KAG8533735.1 hypothetical protein KY384_001476 [Bacidia gigantensis]
MTISEQMYLAAASRPLRGTLLLLLFLGSYYFGNPFSATPAVPGKPTKEDGTSWTSWVADSEQAKSPASNSSLKLNELHENGPRIRQATMIYETDKFNSVYERAVDSHLRHGERWNNPTHILRHDIVDAGFFNKPAFLLGIVINEMAKPYGKRADWLVYVAWAVAGLPRWFDADTVLLNNEVSWSLFLPPPEFNEINFLATKDQNGFNAGMFFIRICEWSVNMLSEVVSLRQFKPTLELPFYDQSAMLWAIERPGYEEHAVYQPHNWWNSFGVQGQPMPTDRFLLHFAGVDCCGGPESKGTIMTRWLDKMDINPDEYSTPLDDLTLPAEVKEFWSNLITARKTMETADQWSMDNKYEGNDLKAARVELRQTMMSEADDFAKINAGVKRMENIMSDASKRVDGDR